MVKEIMRQMKGMRLFQRIIPHLEDNFLTPGSAIHHDGAVFVVDEELTPTCECLAVFIWLQLIDSRLPAYMSRVYAHDLQNKSLKYIQLQLADSMETILEEIKHSRKYPRFDKSLNVNYQL